MSTIYHLVDNFQLLRSKYRHLYVLSLMILFWTVFEGIISFITPLLIIQNGISKTEMGFIISLSSIAGAAFDFAMCWFFKNAKHRRILIVMFALSFVYPLILMGARVPAVFALAMVLWGFLYDLHNISNFEFVGNHIEKEDHVTGFGLIHVFQSVGYLLAPIIAGLVIGASVGWQPFVMAWVFLVIALIFFIILGFVAKKEREDFSLRENCRPIKFLIEMSLWHRIGRLIAPVLILTALLSITDSFFWTIGPLLAESFPRYHQAAGLFMTAFTLPPLLVGWFVGGITAKYGKKKTAFVSFLIGSLVLASFYFFKNPAVLMGIIFLASFFISFAWPSINGAYADYISEAGKYRREIEALEDFFVNLGFIIGPIMAGFMADKASDTAAFSILGLFGAVVAFILLVVTPKNIRISKVSETPSRFEVINELQRDEFFKR